MGRRSVVFSRLVGVAIWGISYLLQLHLSPLPIIWVGIEGCDDAASDCDSIHLGQTGAAVGMQM